METVFCEPGFAENLAGVVDQLRNFATVLSVRLRISELHAGTTIARYEERLEGGIKSCLSKDIFD